MCIAGYSIKFSFKKACAWEVCDEGGMSKACQMCYLGACGRHANEGMCNALCMSRRRHVMWVVHVTSHGGHATVVTHEAS